MMKATGFSPQTATESPETGKTDESSPTLGPARKGKPRHAAMYVQQGASSSAPNVGPAEDSHTEEDASDVESYSSIAILELGLKVSQAKREQSESPSLDDVETNKQESAHMSGQDEKKARIAAAIAKAKAKKAAADKEKES